MQKITCPSCSNQFESELPTVCPVCSEKITIASKKHSLEGIALVFIKRVTGKEFGPFPKDKIISLVKQNKILPEEYLSQDKQNWIKVSSFEEFNDSNVKSGLLGLQSDLPGLKNDLPGLKNDLPGLKNDLPGLKNDLPGLKNDLPGLKNDLPGLKNDLPGLKNDLPGLKNDLPGLKNDLPGVRSDLPGVRSDLPGVRNDLPGVRNDLPDVKSDLPSVRNDLPGVRSDLPGVRNDLPDVKSDLQRNNGDSIPLSITKENSEELSHEKSDILGNGLELNLDSGGLLDDFVPPSEALSSEEEADFDISVFSGANSPDSTESNEEFHSFMSDIEKKKKIELVEEKQGSVIFKRILPLILIILSFIAVDFFVHITPIFKTSSDTSVNKKKNINKSKKLKVVNKNNSVKKNKTKNEPAFEINSNKLINFLKMGRNTSCETALWLALNHHIYNYLDKCKFISGKKPVYSPRQDISTINILRLIFLSSNFSKELDLKIWVGSEIKEPVKKARIIVSQFLSKNRKSPFWNQMAGYLAFTQNNYKKAISFLEASLTQSTRFNTSTAYFLILSGQTEYSKKLLKIDPFYGYLGLAIQPLISGNISEYSLLSPTIKIIPDKKRLDIFNEERKNIGKRIESRIRALSALYYWNRGEFSKSFSECNKAVIIDKYEKISGEICSRIWFYHGLFGKFLKIYGNSNSKWTLKYKIISLIGKSSKVKAIALWNDIKDQKLNIVDLLKPWINIFTENNIDKFNSSVAEIWKKRPYEAMEFLLYLSWIRNDVAKNILDILNTLNVNKKELSSLNFINSLNSISEFYSKHYRKSVDYIDKLKGLSKGQICPFISLKAIDLESTSLEKNIKITNNSECFKYTARGLSALLYRKVKQGKFKEAYSLINDNEQDIIDEIFFTSASAVFLKGNRQDRLHRAKYFVDKLLKLNQNNLNNRFYLAKIFIESGKYQQGEKILENIVFSKNKIETELLLRWIKIEINQSRYIKAIEILNKGKKKAPKNSDILYELAKVYSLLNSPKKVIENLNKIKQKTKASGKINLLLGKSYLKLRMIKKSENAFRQAVKSKNSSPEANFQYGKALISNGKVRKSIKYLSLAIEKYEKIQIKSKNKNLKIKWIPEAYRLLGGGYKEIGKRKKAIFYFRKFAAVVKEGALKEEALRLLRSLNAE